jgi:hypothetical protein
MVTVMAEATATAEATVTGKRLDSSVGGTMEPSWRQADVFPIIMRVID